MGPYGDLLIYDTARPLVIYWAISYPYFLGFRLLQVYEIITPAQRELAVTFIGSITNSFFVPFMIAFVKRYERPPPNENRFRGLCLVICAFVGGI